MSEQIGLRAATAADEPMLYELYASSRQAEMHMWGWTPKQAEPFLRMQWHARKRSYAAEFPNARDQIIVKDGKAVGRCLLAARPTYWRLVDLALQETSRGQGIGTSVLRILQQRAAICGMALRLSVSPDNPALRLYERMGFAHKGGTEMHLFMQWLPGQDIDHMKGELR
ncbi:GNAT family N-acetyltransferase [Paenibacillus sp. IB182496]|uniref:GNAT family N-acetyltransferase n=1 Tax=Paenibacillus sabuli TaxID=2772509 RepID=A0A927GQ16_9BACL|nr:GNAT family N-acetyltransferase [Paenibacillus sabuli]MBD2843903.1 GNAT family N-acetyltransferase [Paenibacillus sabuli]